MQCEVSYVLADRAWSRSLKQLLHTGSFSFRTSRVRAPRRWIFSRRDRYILFFSTIPDHAGFSEQSFIWNPSVLFVYDLVIYSVKDLKAFYLFFCIATFASADCVIKVLYEWNWYRYWACDIRYQLVQSSSLSWLSWFKNW